MPCIRLGNSGIVCVAGEYKPGDLPPEGYLEWHEWAEVQRKAGIKQIRVPDMRALPDTAGTEHAGNPVDRLRPAQAAARKIGVRVREVCREAAGWRIVTGKRKSADAVVDRIGRHVSLRRRDRAGRQSQTIGPNGWWTGDPVAKRTNKLIRRIAQHQSCPCSWRTRLAPSPRPDTGERGLRDKGWFWLLQRSHPDLVETTARCRRVRRGSPRERAVCGVRRRPFA